MGNLDGLLAEFEVRLWLTGEHVACRITSLSDRKHDTYYTAYGATAGEAAEKAAQWADFILNPQRPLWTQQEIDAINRRSENMRRQISLHYTESRTK